MRRTAERDEESRVASSDMLDAAFRLPDRGADPLGMRGFRVPGRIAEKVMGQ